MATPPTAQTNEEDGHGTLLLAVSPPNSGGISILYLPVRQSTTVILKARSKRGTHQFQTCRQRWTSGRRDFVRRWASSAVSTGLLPGDSSLIPTHELADSRSRSGLVYSLMSNAIRHKFCPFSPVNCRYANVTVTLSLPDKYRK